MTEQQYDLVVIGAGAGGLATALAAARLGVRTLLVERDADIGGTAVRAGVSIWEPSVSGSGIAREIYQRLDKRPDAVGVYSIGHHACWPTPGYPVYPGGQSVIDTSKRYDDTLRRYGSKGIGEDEAVVRRAWHGVPFEPAAYTQVLEELLHETTRCAIWRNSEVLEVHATDGTVSSCLLRHGAHLQQVRAEYWVDATGDVAFCAQLGCELHTGTDGQALFHEADAPANPSEETNGVTLIYRVTRERRCWQPPPVAIPTTCWWRKDFPAASITEFPNGDWHVNMLPTMEGTAYRHADVAEAYQECVRRVWAHWRWTQQAWPDFANYGIAWLAPRLGVREGPRVVGDYVLIEDDLLAGISAQRHADIIAIADHAIDLHGSVQRTGCQEVSEPYGIPFRCLLPRGWQNLLVACRGASFSHIAAASCRLTRTMLQLGQAAGTAVALAKTHGVRPRALKPSELRASLLAQGVVLDYRQLPLDAQQEGSGVA